MRPPELPDLATLRDLHRRLRAATESDTDLDRGGKDMKR
jgi:hypothetical protein